MRTDGLVEALCKQDPRVSELSKVATEPKLCQRNSTSKNLDFHVFAHNGKHFAFDSRNYNIAELDKAAALQLKAFLAGEPAGENPTADAVSSRVASFLDSDFFSATPIDEPQGARFDRLVLMLAGGCNMGCSYCFEQNVPIHQSPNRLTKEMADRILDWFFANYSGSSIYVQFYGGEPLLAWDVLEHALERIDRFAIEGAVHVTKYLITNGTLLDDARARYLADHNVVVQLSIDGDRHTHDRHRTMKRGAGTHAKVVNAANSLKRGGGNYNLRAVVTKANLGIDEILDSLQALGTDQVHFGVVSTRSAEMRLTRSDWEELVARYRNYIRQKSAAGEIPTVIRATIANIIKRRRVHYGCGAGLSEVTVAPDGNIYECQRLIGQPIGTVSEGKSLADLGSTFLTAVDRRPNCNECFARYICGGGCKESFLVETGTDQPFYGYCLLKRAEVEEAVALIADNPFTVGITHGVRFLSHDEGLGDEKEVLQQTNR